MKHIFTLFLVAFISINIQAQQLTTSTSEATQTISSTTIDAKPVIVLPENIMVFKESEYDFGKIPQGKPVTHVFVVENQSKEILKIGNVVASCGCTTPEWEKDKAIGPGESSNITVGYNAAAEGPFNKFITVSYNETQSKQISIKGEVWKTPETSAPVNKGINDLKN